MAIDARIPLMIQPANIAGNIAQGQRDREAMSRMVTQNKLYDISLKAAQRQEEFEQANRPLVEEAQRRELLNKTLPYVIPKVQTAFDAGNFDEAAQIVENFAGGAMPEADKMAADLRRLGSQGVMPPEQQEALKERMGAVLQDLGQMYPMQQERAKDPEMWEAFVQDYQKENPGASRAQAITAYRAAGKPEGTNVTVQPNPPEPSEFEKSTDRALATSYQGMFDANAATAEIESRLDEMQNLMQSVETGRFQNIEAAMGEWLDTDAGTARQVWRAQQVPIMLQLAESVSGPMTEKEWDMLRSSLPDFGLSREANENVMRIMRQAIARTRANYKSAEAYLEQRRADGKDVTLRGWSPPFKTYDHSKTKVGRFELVE